MTEIQVEVKQEDLETLVNSAPIMRMRLQNIALQRTVEEQAAEIRRLNEDMSSLHSLVYEESTKQNEGEDDAESG